MATVAIVEDDAKTSRLLADLLADAGFAAGPICPDAEAARALLTAAQPDIVLMDIDLPGASGIECVRRLRPHLPRTQFVMLTVYDDAENIYEALAAGAVGYLLKRAVATELAPALRDVLAGGSPMTSSVARKVVHSFQPTRHGVAEIEQLSERERQVLQLLAQGRIYKEIAEQLGVSENTIRSYIRRIYEKLHVRSRMEAVAKLPRITDRTIATLLSFVLLAGVAATLHAQSAPAAPTATKPATAVPSEDLIEMSPFEVRDSIDNPWNATSTLLGNRTNQELVKVPVTVDVLTSEFMRDIGLFNMDDAGAFISGVTVLPRLESRNDNMRLTFRGLSGSANTSRNFFQWQVPSDTYNVERFDFGKGSNSLMFGDSTPGGQVTTTTKRARFTNSGESLLFYDSLNSYRAQLDVNRKISKQFAVRLNVVNRIDNAYVHGSFQTFRAGDLAFTYRPFPNTFISVEGERGQYIRRRADNTAQITNIAAPGRGLSTNNRWYVTSDGEVIHRPPAAGEPAVPTIDTTVASGQAMSLLEGQSVAVRMPNGEPRIYNGFSRSFNILGFGDYLDRPFNVVTAMIEQSIGKLSLQASYNQQFQHQDRNDNSFGGSSSPPVINVDSRGRPYVDMPGSPTPFKIFGDTFKAGRLAIAYPFEFGKWMKQYAVVTATNSKDYNVTRRFGWSNTAAPGLAANNGLLMRAYLDDPASLEAGGWNKFLFPNLPRSATFTPELVESYVNTGPFIDIRYTRNSTASLTGEYFGGRLISLIGVSRNSIARKIPVAAAYLTDARGRITFYGTPESDPAMFTYDPNFSLSASSLTSGLNYALFNRENLKANVYVNYLQSFNWQSQLTFTGRNLGPITGITREAGVKGDFFRGKFGYAVAVYRIERQNAAFAWSPDSLTLAQLEDLFNPNDVLPADPKFFDVENGLNNERRTVNSQEQSRGFEFTLTAQRLFGFQARATFSKTKVEATRDFSEFQALLGAAIARTATANAPGGNRALAESATLIAAAQDIVAANTNITVVTGRRSVPYTASAVLDYQFPRQIPLRLGLTAAWTPNYNITILNGTVYRGGAACPVGLYAMHDRQIFGQRVNFRLGANRAYDLMQGDSKYYKSGGNSFNTATGKPNYVYRYTDPMVTNLSVTVRF